MVQLGLKNLSTWKPLQYSFPRTTPGATPVVTLRRSRRTHQYVIATHPLTRLDFLEIPIYLHDQYARTWGAPCNVLSEHIADRLQHSTEWREKIS